MQTHSRQKDTIRVFDTTLRDGEQTPGVNFSIQQKVDVAARLADFGVCTIEAGFPASSPSDSDAVDAVARTVTSCEIAALARCTDKDIEAAGHALRHARQPVLHIVLGSSDIHISKKLHSDRASIIRAMARGVRHALNFVPEVQFTLEDSSRSDPIFLRQCVNTVVEAGATRVNIADTVGAALPHEFAQTVGDVVRFVPPGIIVSVHCHNDMGLASANTVAGVQAGAGQVEVTVNGLGERAGNAAVEEVAIILAKKGIASAGLDLTKVCELSQCVSRFSGIRVQPNHPVVGANAFAHSSGIHQDGIIKAQETYGYISPHEVGAGEHRFVLTARSGRNALAHEIKGMGIDLSKPQLESAYKAFLKVADECHGAVSSEVIGTIAHGARSVQ